MNRTLPAILLTFLLFSCFVAVSHADDGVFVRFRLREPQSAYHVKLGGYIHKEPWVLPGAIVPPGADKSNTARAAAGAFTEWFDLAAQAGKHLHGRMRRAGGIAEFPNITAEFITDPPAPRHDVDIELATAPDAAMIIKRWSESFEGTRTSFLVSPKLAEDASHLESAAEMTERRLRWAREATGGVRHSPQQLILQTSFWSPQRPELNVKEGQVLSLLGFNVVGNMPEEVRKQWTEFRAPSASHDVPLDLGTDREAVRAAWDKLDRPDRKLYVDPGAPFNFQDEICARPPIGKGEKALHEFRQWLEAQKVSPTDLGVSRLEEVEPIEDPDELRERMKTNEPAARRVFYYTSRFRQLAGTDRLIWNREEFHRRVGADRLSSTLLADHPYFGGTGLGMGMEEQNTTWGGWPLALDWFDIGRRRAVDLIGIEDWMGLQFMYGPNSTWEGFQLMGFQSAIFRSASRGEMSIIAWITPSDERNLRLKSASALAQGAKHIFFWTYGPTATSTENYWSDLPGAYPGMAHLSRALEFAELVIAPGKPRPTRVALLYSISSDLWQPFGYIHMLERRGLYFALIHDQYLVDLLTEEDLTAGRLQDYRVLYTADPCISTAAAKHITGWLQNGGTLVATAGAGSRNEFGEASNQLAGTFGLQPKISFERQPGEYRVRGRLNELQSLDRMKLADAELGVIALKATVQPGTGEVKARFTATGQPALVENRVGKGRAAYFASALGTSYIKEARFVPDQLAERWPPSYRAALARYAAEAGAAPLVKLSHPVVEAGIYDAPAGTALILANFTYEPIKTLTVELPTRGAIKEVQSLEHGRLTFESHPAPAPWRDEGFPHVQRFTLPLGDNDVVLVR